MANAKPLRLSSNRTKEFASTDTIPTNNLGTGTADATTVLYGDNVWRVPAGGSGSGITRSVLPISSTTTGAATALVDYVYLCTGTFTYTQPTAVSNTNRYAIKNRGTGVITIVFTGGQNADGLTSISLTANQSVEFISNNTNYNII